MQYICGRLTIFKSSLQNIRHETYRSKTFGSKRTEVVHLQNIWLENVPKLCTCKTFGSKMYRSCAPAKHLAQNVPKQNIWLKTYRSKTFGSKRTEAKHLAQNVPKQNIRPEMYRSKIFGSKGTEAKHLAQNVPKQNIWPEMYRSKTFGSKGTEVAFRHMIWP